MGDVTYTINGHVYRGFIYWSHQTIPPTLCGMTYKHALALEARRQSVLHPKESSDGR